MSGASRFQQYEIGQDRLEKFYRIILFVVLVKVEFQFFQNMKFGYEHRRLFVG